MPRARGVCPHCGRTIAGRGDGQGWVILAPHTRVQSRDKAEPCLSLGGYRRVRRLPDTPQRDT